MMVNIIGLLFVFACFQMAESVVLRHEHLVTKIEALIDLTERVSDHYRSHRFHGREFDTNDVNITLPQLPFDVAQSAQEGDLLFTHVTDLNIYHQVLLLVKANEADVNKNSVVNFSDKYQGICDLITVIIEKMTTIITNKGLSGSMLRNVTAVDYMYMNNKADLNNYSMELLNTVTDYVTDIHIHVTAMYRVYTT